MRSRCHSGFGRLSGSNGRIRPALSATVALLFLLSVAAPSAAISGESTGQAASPGRVGAGAGGLFTRPDSFAAYLDAHGDWLPGSGPIRIAADAFQGDADARLAILPELDGELHAVHVREPSGSLEAPFSVETAGLYRIAIRYRPMPGEGRDIEFGLQIDGSYPFFECEQLRLSRIWTDAEAIGTDNQGNQIRPSQVESPRWRTATLRDAEGYYAEDLVFHLEAGAHAIRLLPLQEPFALARVDLVPADRPASWRDLAERSGARRTSGVRLEFQAEQPESKSHTVLYAMSDRRSPATTPNAPGRTLLNTIGRYNWNYPGQWISWRIEVPESGLYRIAFRARQNFVRGLETTRRLVLDGQVPCAEAMTIGFPYSNRWQVLFVGGSDPMEVYLEAGAHDLALEVVPGAVAETLRDIDTAVSRLNTLYRRILVITGSTPDLGRDYDLHKEVPGLIGELTDIAKRLREVSVRVEGRASGTGSEFSTLKETIYQLDGFVEKPESIPGRLARFRDNVSALGAWMLRMKEQPLELDSLWILSADQALPKADASWPRQLAFDVQAFLLSFLSRSGAIGNVHDPKDRTLTVWAIGAGRDQAQIAKSFIDDRYTPKTGIGVNLDLVPDPSVLTQAILAGKGPDAAIMVPREIPVNLAYRGALKDLSSYPGFSSTREEFLPSAFAPYEFQGGVYALPEVQSYLMMFVRDDIFAELDIVPPVTWDDLYGIIPTIQKRKLSIGIPAAQILFETLLFQHGGTFYNPERTKSGFDAPEALAAFSQWTSFYTDYGFPLAYDLYNRFRTGEMPLGIAAYSFANLLRVAAPEIRGLWSMHPIPGIRDEAGTIRNQSGATGTGCILMASSDDPESGFGFLQWWVSAEIQALYGNELENTMGPLARYETANLEAFQSLPWTRAERDTLAGQWRSVEDIPQLPGNYFTNRNLLFAFRAVTYRYENRRAVLKRYTREIDAEILRKRKEYAAP